MAGKKYKDDDWKDDYFTRHRAEYKRPVQPVDEEKPLHPEVPAARKGIITDIIDAMNTVSEALKPKPE